MRPDHISQVTEQKKKTKPNNKEQNPQPIIEKRHKQNPTTLRAPATLTQFLNHFSDGP